MSIWGRPGSSRGRRVASGTADAGRRRRVRIGRRIREDRNDPATEPGPPPDTAERDPPVGRGPQVMESEPRRRRPPRRRSSRSRPMRSGIGSVRTIVRRQVTSRRPNHGHAAAQALRRGPRRRPAPPSPPADVGADADGRRPPNDPRRRGARRVLGPTPPSSRVVVRRLSVAVVPSCMVTPRSSSTRGARARAWRV